MDSIQDEIPSATDVERDIKARQRFWARVHIGPHCWEWQGSTNRDGYGTLAVNKQAWFAHRYVFKTIGVEIPEGRSIDHICHNTRCVRPAHLRFVTHKQNMENRAGAEKSSRTGIRGVSWHKHSSKWQARICHDGRQISVGYFDDIREAEAAAKAKRNELFTHNAADRIGRAA